MSDWLQWLLRAWISVALLVGLAAAADDGDGSSRARAAEASTPEIPASETADIETRATTTTTRPGAASTSSASDTPPVVARPIGVDAPSVGISADLIPVGKTPDGALAVPDFGTAGWYEQSVRPGEDGTAVLAGHVDSTSGPDVFYALEALTKGDEIQVRRADGTTISYLVDLVETTDKDELPVERVFGDTGEPALRLITCGGVFDRSIRSYESNVIVYASPA